MVKIFFYTKLLIMTNNNEFVCSKQKFRIQRYLPYVESGFFVFIYRHFNQYFPTLSQEI